MEKLEKPDWNELARNVSAVLRFTRPLAHLEKIPEAIEAAKAKIGEADDEIKKKGTELESIKKQIVVVNKELAKAEAGRETALTEMAQEVKDERDKLTAEIANDTAKLVKAKHDATDDLTRFIAEAEKRKAQVSADIQAAEERLVEIRKTLEEHERVIASVLKR